MATDLGQPHATNPKVFISYSWTSPGHQARVQQWADQLLADGIDVVLDVYDLKEGHDKFAFMERLVTDPSVTHVLVLSDREYAEKADQRRAGVGTESQIISREVYERVDQSKFIPVVCEFDDNREPCLPIFLKSRVWIDFSTHEAVNHNWERLVRVLYGEPAQVKPERGERPAYLRSHDVTLAARPTIAKFNVLQEAILRRDDRLNAYRRDYLDACFTYADALRVRKPPETKEFGGRVLDDCGQLRLFRDHIAQWVLAETVGSPVASFTENLLDVLERMLDLKSRPPELNSWNDEWFAAMSISMYETFLYIVAALIRNEAFPVLHDILHSSYLLPETEAYGNDKFGRFDRFYGHSESLQAVLAPPGKRLYSPAAELLKRQADRDDIPFSSVMQAELVVLLVSFLMPRVRWYPQTLHYAAYEKGFPLFVRATRRRDFAKLAAITGITDADQLRKAVREGQELAGVSSWHDFRPYMDFGQAMNLDKLDTIP